ncbi:ferredoxin [Acidiferrimicrobium sp. IK]|uniref:ferredoxin n=1 Tax=Acidiferrimicrobium sp. IK TaxID=2871700 RepID=UPI0021CB35A7|nr:ferredoxin [Acidiferrimicrobium sp. IK]MCU4186517.1 ferredoxin [Acidiferrimicrobium sp. IK]
MTRLAPQVIVVDPVACDGHGVCAELLPEMISLDPWGYPIISGDPVPPGLLREAERAVASCPRLALHLLPAPEVPPVKPARRQVAMPPPRTRSRS